MRYRGFIALFTVLALLAFSFSLMTAVTYLSIGEAQTGLARAQGDAAMALAEGCAEDALLQSSRDGSYTGGTVAYLGGTCTISVSKNDPVWTMDISGTKDRFTRSIRIIFRYTSSVPALLTLMSWLEQ